MQKVENTEVTSLVVWKQTDFGEWINFFNIEQKFTHLTKKESQTKNSADQIALSKAVKMGSLVMTPKGIGRLIKLEDSIVVVKFIKSNTELTFNEKEISNDFPLVLKFINQEINYSFMITVPSNGSVETLKSQIEKQGILSEKNSSIFLIYNGQELKDELFFDSLDMMPNSKILICSQKMVPMKISRFTTIYTYWYSYNQDGITFSVNKKIKLTGIGLYGSHENKTQNGTLKVFEGTVANSGNTLYEEPVEVPPAPEQANCITEIKFKKGINIKPANEYTLQLISTNYCYFYYGSLGKAITTGEKDIEFTFKYTLGSSHGSNAETGNFPEFYYMA